MQNVYYIYYLQIYFDKYFYQNIINVKFDKLFYHLDNGKATYT